MAKPILSNDDPRIKKAKKSKKSLQYIGFLEHEKESIIFDLNAILSMSGHLPVAQLLADNDKSDEMTVRELFNLLHINKLINLHLDLVRIRSEWFRYRNAYN